MTTRERLIRELENLPETLLEKVVDLVRAFREEEGNNGTETALASEASLGQNWLKPEKDKAWKDL